MNAADIRAEMEKDMAWRIDEIRDLRNQLQHIRDEHHKNRFRRVLVVMLYSHYEGYCKFAFLRYVSAINSASIKCDQGVPAVVAGAWHELFDTIEKPEKKSALFKAQLPEDRKLHRFARRKEFVECFSEFGEQPLEVSEKTVDTASNLLPIIMKKNLFLIGLNHDAFASHDGAVLSLINRRNSIAHGSSPEGIDHKAYSKLEESVIEIMEDLTELIMDAVKNESYKKDGNREPELNPT